MWLERIADLLTDPTVLTVTLGALMLGLTSGALGTFAVLRRQSLLGDAMSHAALPGVVIGFLIAGGRSLPFMLLGALATGLAAALLSVILSRRRGIKTESALGVSLGIGFALGVVLLSYVQKMPGAGGAGLEQFLFGQAAATLRSDLITIGALGFVALASVTLMFRQLKIVTFDPQFARANGFNVELYEAVSTALLAVAIVVGLQLVGVVLMSALVVTPAAAARQWSGSLTAMLWLAGAIGAGSAVVGALLSSLVPGLATGPTVVLVATFVAVISFLVAPRRGVRVEGA